MDKNTERSIGIIFSLPHDKTVALPKVNAFPDNNSNDSGFNLKF